LIEESLHQLIFLDVQMQDGSGFDVLSRIDSSKIQVIFISAYDKFVITAIKISACDYLLKPVDSFDLARSLEKVKVSVESDD
jgi:two-component system LytT family response regulator